MAARTMANLRKLSQVAAYAAVFSLNTYNVTHNRDNNLVRTVLEKLREQFMEDNDVVIPDIGPETPVETPVEPQKA